MLETRTKQIIPPAIFLSLLMLVGLLLRVYRISHESLWWDEYASHVHLTSESLVEFLLLNRTLDPLALPFYYIFEYLWAHYVHDSVMGLRLMSIFIGIATIPLLYAVGKRIQGPWTGCVAAALLTVSPVHIHHSQSIRMYVLFVFLTALVVWSFLYLFEKPRLSRWIWHGLLSFLMYWTHPFAGLVAAVLGAYLLLYFFERRRLFWGWTLMQAMLLAPSAAYLATVRFWPEHTTADWIARPSLLTLVADIFFDDIAAFHWQLRISDFAQRLGTFRLALDVIFAAVILMLLTYFGMRVYYGNGAARIRLKKIALLPAIWLVLPPLVLFLLSWTVRPCMFPRYTVHCIMALYLLLGGAVAHMRGTARRLAMASLLVGLLFLQWVWLQPGPQRTDWRSTALLLHEQVTADDIVLVESLLWRDVFTHNLDYLSPGPLSAPVAAAETRSLLAAQAALCLGMLPAYTQADAVSEAHVWAVIALDYFEPGPPAAFEAILKARAIQYQRSSFPAIRTVFVYRLTSDTDSILPADIEALLAGQDSIAPTSEGRDGDLDHHAMQAFGDLATALSLHGRDSMALAILDGLFAESAFANQIYANLKKAILTGDGIDDKADAIKALWEGYGFRESQRRAYALRAFSRATDHDPDHAVAHFEGGLELAAAGEYDRARESLARAIECDGAYGDMLGRLLEGLKTGEGVDERLDAVIAYREGLLAIGRNDGATAESHLRRALEKDPAFASANLMLAYVLTNPDLYAAPDTAFYYYMDDSHHPHVNDAAQSALKYAEEKQIDYALERLERLFGRFPNARHSYNSLVDALTTERAIESAVESIRAFWSAVDARERGDEEQAFDLLARSVAHNAHNALAQMEYGMDLLLRGDQVRGLAALARAIALDNGCGVMIDGVFAGREPAQATEETFEAIGLFRKGMMAIGEEKHKEAEKVLERVLELEPAFTPAQHMLEYVHTIGDRFERADTLLQQYLALSDMPDVDGYAHMALIQVEHNRPDLAHNTLSHLFQKHPQARKVYGSLYASAAQDEEAQQAAASIRALWAGFEAQRKGHVEAARHAFFTASELDSNNTLASLEFGLESAAAGNRDDAITALSRASDGDVEYRALLHYLLTDLRNEGAISNSLDAVRVYRKGLLAQSESRDEDALIHFDAAIAADPRLDDVHTSRAFTLIGLGRYDAAYQGIQRYLSQSESPVPGAYGLLALVYVARNQGDEALRAAQTAVAMDEAYAAQFGPLLYALIKERDYDATIAEMERLKAQGVDLYPLMHDIVLTCLSDDAESGAGVPDTASATTSRWRDAIDAFIAEDATSSPLSGGVLFTGSSTIRLWDLQRWFPHRPTRNRGFGGSQFVDLLEFAPGIIGVHVPDTIVVYSGDNDIQAGKSPEQVAADGIAVVKRFRALVPEATLVVLGIKPSRSRWEKYPAMGQANARLKAFAATHADVVFLDLGNLLLDAEGMPREACYLDDALHFSEEGYRRWSEALEAVL